MSWPLKNSNGAPKRKADHIPSIQTWCVFEHVFPFKIWQSYTSLLCQKNQGDTYPLNKSWLAACKRSKLLEVVAMPFFFIAYKVGPKTTFLLGWNGAPVSRVKTPAICLWAEIASYYKVGPSSFWGARNSTYRAIFNACVTHLYTGQPWGPLLKVKLLVGYL